MVAIEGCIFGRKERLANEIWNLGELNGIPTFRVELGHKGAITRQNSRNCGRLVILDSRELWEVANEVVISPHSEEPPDTCET
jgi:hypothetical protein